MKTPALKKPAKVLHWLLELPYFTPEEERESIPEEHRKGCDWTCRAISQDGNHKVAGWDKTPTLALARACRVIYRNLPMGDTVEIEEQFTPAEFSALCSEAEEFSWVTQEFKVWIENGAELKVLFFNPRESKLIWTHVQQRGGHTMKTHVCATYQDGVLSTLELDFWMSIRLAQRNEMGKDTEAFNIGFRYEGNASELESAPVDLGRFNWQRFATPVNYTGIEERFRKLSRGEGLFYDIRFPNGDEETTIRVPYRLTRPKDFQVTA